MEKRIVEVREPSRNTWAGLSLWMAAREMERSRMVAELDRRIRAEVRKGERHE